MSTGAAAASWDAEYASGRYRHDPPVGSFTVRYLDGPKAGLEIRFFAAAELTGLIGKGFTALMPLRLDSTPHVPPATGQWSQWEAIWRRRHPVIESQHAGRAASDPASATRLTRRAG